MNPVGKVYFFYTEQAEQCRAMDSVYSEIESLYKDRLEFHKVDVEANPKLVQKFAVSAVPAFIFAIHDCVVERVDGVKPAQLLQATVSLVNKCAELDTKCTNLISAQPLMLFIKGTPEAPRCGFTGQLLSLLKSHAITKFGYYNILEDEPVRQHLKVRSQWPTYPQVYHRGELVGGIDILKEMAESGELARLAKQL
jgi:Grx4 family monothiol glutaredoxin